MTYQVQMENTKTGKENALIPEHEHDVTVRRWGVSRNSLFA